MADHENQSPAEILHELTDGQRVVTHIDTTGGALDARPLTVLEQDPAGTFRFLVDRSKGWVRDGEVLLAFTDEKHGRWLSAAGHQHVVGDRAVIERLWSPLARAWFESPDDPDLVALEVVVERFSWWDSASNRLVRAAELVTSAVRGPGRGDAEGDHGHGRLQPGA
jgi:general stress protein 26